MFREFMRSIAQPVGIIAVGTPNMTSFACATISSFGSTQIRPIPIIHFVLKKSSPLIQRLSSHTSHTFSLLSETQANIASKYGNMQQNRDYSEFVIRELDSSNCFIFDAVAVLALELIDITPFDTNCLVFSQVTQVDIRTKDSYLCYKNQTFASMR